MENSSKQISRV